MTSYHLDATPGELVSGYALTMSVAFLVGASSPWAVRRLHDLDRLVLGIVRAPRRLREAAAALREINRRLELLERRVDELAGARDTHARNANAALRTAQETRRELGKLAKRVEP